MTSFGKETKEDQKPKQVPALAVGLLLLTNRARTDKREREKDIQGRLSFSSFFPPSRNKEPEGRTDGKERKKRGSFSYIYEYICSFRY